jgi:hypothetical protein
VKIYRAHQGFEGSLIISGTMDDLDTLRGTLSVTRDALQCWYNTMLLLECVPPKVPYEVMPENVAKLFNAYVTLTSSQSPFESTNVVF